MTLDTTIITEGDSGTTEQVLTITPALTFSETGVTLGSAVTISNLAIGSASTATATGAALDNAGTIGVDFTIDNDDGIVSMAATTVSVMEGSMAAVTVQLNDAQSEDVVVVVTTSDGTAKSTDLTGETTPDYGTPDYTALTGNAAQVTIAANATEATVMIATLEGARLDSNSVPVPIVELAEETFTVTIDSVMSGPAVLHDDSAMLSTTVTITDDD